MSSLESRVLRPGDIQPVARLGGTVVHGETIFCVSCGHPGGRVPIEMDRSAGDVIYLCASGSETSCGCNCEGKFGAPPEMIFTKVPDPVGFKRIYANPNNPLGGTR